MSSTRQPSTCPVAPDATFGGPVELVIFLESEFTVGTNRELLERALRFIAESFQPHYGAPVRFIEAPDWTVQGIARLTAARSEDSSIPVRLERLELLGEPLRLRRLDTVRSDFDFELTLRADRNDLCATEADFTEHPDWWLEWQIIGALVSGAVDRGDLQGRDELLEAVKLGLSDVLDVRIRQLEVTDLIHKELA